MLDLSPVQPIETNIVRTKINPVIIGLICFVLAGCVGVEVGVLTDEGVAKADDNTVLDLVKGIEAKEEFVPRVADRMAITYATGQDRQLILKTNSNIFYFKNGNSLSLESTVGDKDSNLSYSKRIQIGNGVGNLQDGSTLDGVETYIDDNDATYIVMIDHSTNKDYLPFNGRRANSSSQLVSIKIT